METPVTPPNRLTGQMDAHSTMLKPPGSDNSTEESISKVDLTAINKNVRWPANLNLHLEQRHDRTVISQRRHKGPLQIQKPFYPEGPVCHIYLLHPPGGIVGGDSLHLDITLHPSAQCVVTTPAAGKFYRSEGLLGQQVVNMDVQNNCSMEWLPQETILFNSCYAHTVTKVNLAENAKYIGWDIVCFGRPAANELFVQGVYRQQVELWRDNNPLLIERGLFESSSDILNAYWGLSGFSVMGTLIATPADRTLLNSVRQLFSTLSKEHLSATLINNILVCRYIGNHAEHAKNHLTAIWKIIRPKINNKPACIPRIWNT